ncbi:cupin domain-containing protein [Terriglobus saanensis]|nr:cupin domain-containing protein [Terriglobus saanensis]
MANGAEFRSIVHGELKTGESVDLHETMQPVGTVPSPLHAIQHSEFIVVREGMIVFVHEGKVERVGPGGVMYVALGTIHSLKNVGDVPARYVVIAIGGDVKK